MSRLTTVKRRALRHQSMRQAQAARELARLVRTLAGSPLFDREGYERQRGRTFPHAAAAAWDYVVVGSREGMAAGPLLVVPHVAAHGRGAGVGPAAWWAAQVRRTGFPRTTAHPMADTDWYRREYPEAAAWRGGPLAHYTERGRHDGCRLGPLDPGGTDLVELGRLVIRDVASTTTAFVAEPGTVDDGSGVGALVLLGDDVGGMSGVVAAALDPGSGVTALVLAVSTPTTTESRIVTAALALLTPRVRLVHEAGTVAHVLDAAARACGGSTLLVVTSPVDVGPEDLGRLVGAVSAGAPAVLAAPIVLADDDTIVAAGTERDGAHVRPVLLGFPLADGARGGDHAVSGITGDIFAIRRPALESVGGFVGTAGRGPEAHGIHQLGQDLSARVTGGGGRIELVSSATAALLHASSTSWPAPGAPAYADPATPTILRWAIKSPHPAGPRRRTWGDYHFALALAEALERLGHHVAIDPLDSWHRPTARLDQVTVTLRGLHRHTPSPEQINLLWIISHPELVTGGELAAFDAVFAASRSWARAASSRGPAVEPLLQCTDAALFTPDAAEPGTGYPLLFVGNSRSARRPLVEAAIETGRDLAIIGGGWAGRVPSAMVRAEYVANAELPVLYRSAGVVLNDHWPEMARDGFLSNRLFDLTAAGARWVSDPATDLTEVFPTGRVASTSRELDALLRGAPDTFATEAELRAASEEVRANHSFDARAATLSETVSGLIEARERQ